MAAMPILKAASCSGDISITAILINKKEGPHKEANMSRRSKFLYFITLNCYLVKAA